MAKVSRICFITALFSCSFVYADGFNLHGVGGVSFVNMNGTSYLNLGQATDQFKTTSGTKTSGVWGLGAGYGKDLVVKNHPIAFDFDFTAYYTQSNLSGVQTPAVNLINQADTLNYSANMSNWAYMFEPKIISKQNPFEPYVKFGLGFSNNEVNQYKEVPSNPNSSAVTTNAFAGQTNTNFAWEVGAGIQHTLYHLPKGGDIILAGEYRYMDWGPIMLGKTPAQTTDNGPNFGHYRTNLVDVTLSLHY